MTFVSLKNSKVQSILLIIISKCSFVLMMALSKFLKSYSPLQINFIRSFLVFSVMTPYLIAFKGKASLKTKQPFLQLIRVSLSVFYMVCFFYAYCMLSIAKASAINFSYALIVPLFAALFLKEKVSRQRWVFLILGYLGTLIIINPIFDTFDIGEILALLGVTSLASSSILVKKLTRTDESSVVVFYSAIASSLLLGLYFFLNELFSFNKDLPQWVSLEKKDTAMYLLIGLLSLIGQFTYVQAYRKGRLNFLAGFDYLKFLFGAFIGFLLFKEHIEQTTFYGALVILLCSYAITREELKIKSENENY